MNYFPRKFVRLGEHDLRTTDDGPHQNIPIVRSVKHPQQYSYYKLNDIAVLHLELDVEFSGEI